MRILGAGCPALQLDALRLEVPDVREVPLEADLLTGLVEEKPTNRRDRRPRGPGAHPRRRTG